MTDTNLQILELPLEAAISSTTRPQGNRVTTNPVVFESVGKTFRHRPAWFNFMGRERAGQTQALQEITFSVASGNVLVLLGPNESGKTTALKLIATVLLPDSGHVLVHGVDTLTQSSEVRKRVGFAVASERSFFPRLSARENLDFFAALNDVPRKARPDWIEKILDQTGLSNSADTLVMKFSTGMYQRLGLARALIKNPSILLLDEPTRSLDPGSKAHFWSTVRSLASQGTTVLLATHDFNEAVAVGDRLAVLDRGRIAGQEPISCATRVDHLRDFYFDLTGEPEETQPLAAGGRR